MMNKKKRRETMKHYLLAAILAFLIVFTVGAEAGVLFSDNFDYDAGQLTSVSGGNWVNFSGTGYYIQCVDGNLAYPSYSASNIGRMIQIVRHPLNSSAEDVHCQFASQSSGTTVYASLLFRVTHDSMSPDTSTNGQHWAMFMPNNSITMQFGRISTKMAVTPGKYYIGLRATHDNSTIWYTTMLDVNTTYLIVLAYESISGNTNDIAKLWINPTLTGSEPTPDLMQTSALTTDPTNIARLAIRQGSATNSNSVTPSADIDGIIVGTSWNDITGVAVSPIGQTNVTFALAPINPNPISRFAQIKYSLKESGKVNLGVFNILGQQVASLVDGHQTAGNHTAIWRLRDDKGSLVPNGIYFVKLSSKGQSMTRRALVVK